MLLDVHVASGMDRETLTCKVHVWYTNGKYREFGIHPYFYMEIDNPHRAIATLEDAGIKTEITEISTIYDTKKSIKIHMDPRDRELVHSIEKNFKEARLYNVDVRLSHRFMVREGIFPFCEESRMSLDLDIPLQVMWLNIIGDKMRGILKGIEINGEVLEGGLREILLDVQHIISRMDPDVILLEKADFWIPYLIQKANQFGLDFEIGRGKGYRKKEENTYFSYGRMYHRPYALLPKGRHLIDPACFMYRETGLKGLILLSRISGIPLQEAARLTPRTLISNYEVLCALEKDIAIPYRKADAERVKTLVTLMEADRGGLTLRPLAGIHKNVTEMDFTSMYPSLMVRYNLSPETVGCQCGKDYTIPEINYRVCMKRRGFLSSAIRPLLQLRQYTKKLKKENREFEPVDRGLKWLLWTCFGYTGYRNAKFGSIEVHESITALGRDALIRAKDIAEKTGWKVIHGIVDSLWIKGGHNTEEVRERIEKEVGIPIEIKGVYQWIVFLPLKYSHIGSVNRFFGRTGNTIKVRGLMCRRSDTPPAIKKFQEEILEKFDPEKPRRTRDMIERAFKRYTRAIINRMIDPKDLVIRKRVGKQIDEYQHFTITKAAIIEYRRRGVDISPGDVVSFVVEDYTKKRVAILSDSLDCEYYIKLLKEAKDEILWAIEKI